MTADVTTTLTSPAVVTAALTGPSASKADNPALPVTPAEIAADAESVWASGASIVHIHLRDEAGKATADLKIARRVLGLIQEVCPAQIQLSTGVGLDVPFEARAKLVEARPAMASLNVCSMSFGSGELRNPPDGVRRLAARMQELDIQPELEIYDSGHLDVALELREEGLLTDPLHLSLVLGVRGGMAATPANLVNVASRLPPGSVWQVVGIGPCNLSMTSLGLAMGANARTGLEDTLFIRPGQPASGNAELVSRLVQLAQAMDRPVADVDTTRAQLGLAAKAPRSEHNQQPAPDPPGR